MNKPTEHPIYALGNNQGQKFDTGKRRYSLLPAGTVNQVVDVLEIGAAKYSPDNWQHVPNARARYYDAAQRHIDAWWLAENPPDALDPETSRHHLAHAVCCLLFLLWADTTAQGVQP